MSKHVQDNSITEYEVPFPKEPTPALPKTSKSPKSLKKRKKRKSPGKKSPKRKSKKSPSPSKSAAVQFSDSDSGDIHNQDDELRDKTIRDGAATFIGSGFVPGWNQPIGPRCSIMNIIGTRDSVITLPEPIQSFIDTDDIYVTAKNSYHEKLRRKVRKQAQQSWVGNTVRA
jgi:hypothetical protein